MKNGKAGGLDELQAELPKYRAAETGYLGVVIYPIIYHILNKAISENFDIFAVLGARILAPLTEPGKPQGPCKRLRMVELLICNPQGAIACSAQVHSTRLGESPSNRCSHDSHKARAQHMGCGRKTVWWPEARGTHG